MTVESVCDSFTMYVIYYGYHLLFTTDIYMKMEYVLQVVYLEKSNARMSPPPVCLYCSSSCRVMLTRLVKQCDNV